MTFAKFNICNPCCGKPDEHIVLDCDCVPSTLSMYYRADIAIANTDNQCFADNGPCIQSNIINYQRCTASRILVGARDARGCTIAWQELGHTFDPYVLVCEYTVVDDPDCTLMSGYQLYARNAAFMWVDCSVKKIYFQINFEYFSTSFGNFTNFVRYEANVDGWAGGTLTLNFSGILGPAEGPCGVWPASMTITPISPP